MLDIKNLSIAFDEEDGLHTVVKDFNLHIKEGETVGLVGESGSGKTQVSLAVMGLYKRGAAASSGEMVFKGKNLLSCKRDELRRIQGDRISMIFQEPMTSLNPTMKIGKQVEEALRLHYPDMSKEERKNKAIEALNDVELDGEKLYAMFPHELSGGMRQRVMIAAAIITRPDILVADEPTTALDVAVQDQIIALLKKLNEKYNMAILFVSHDLEVVKKLCGTVVVMRKGEIVESGSTDEIFNAPKEEYTKTLLIKYPKRKPHVTDPEKIVLSVKNLTAGYGSNVVIKDVSFDIRENETVGLVGGSGAGKSTLSRCILGFIKPMSGEVVHYTKLPQMVFQDPYSSLNPKMTIRRILEEPLRIAGNVSKDDRLKKVRDHLKLVELDPDMYMDRYPFELSGGQRQRVCIALTLITGSRFIIIDEGLAALDVTIRSQIMVLLNRLQDELKLSYLFISHDPLMVESMCDRVMNIHDFKAE